MQTEIVKRTILSANLSTLKQRSRRRQDCLRHLARHDAQRELHSRFLDARVLIFITAATALASLCRLFRSWIPVPTDLYN